MQAFKKQLTNLQLTFISCNESKNLSTERRQPRPLSSPSPADAADAADAEDSSPLDFNQVFKPEIREAQKLNTKATELQQDHIETLKAMSSNLIEANQRLQSHVSEFSETNEFLNKENALFPKMIEELNQGVSRLQTEKQKLLSQVQAAYAEVKRLNKKIGDLQSINVVRNTENTMQNVRIFDLTKQNKTLKKLIKMREKTYHNLVRELKETKKNLETQVGEFKETKKKLEAQVIKLKDTVNLLIESNQKKNKRIARLNQERTILKGKVGELTGNNDRLQYENIRIQAENIALQTELNNTNERYKGILVGEQFETVKAFFESTEWRHHTHGLLSCPEGVKEIRKKLAGRNSIELGELGRIVKKRLQKKAYVGCFSIFSGKREEVTERTYTAIRAAVGADANNVTFLVNQINNIRHMLEIREDLVNPAPPQRR